METAVNTGCSAGKLISLTGRGNSPLIKQFNYEENMAKQIQPVQHIETIEPREISEGADRAHTEAEVYFISKVNRKLIIPAKKKSFPNKETLEFTFKAGIPQKVPAAVAKAYAEAYPHVYSIVSDEDAAAILSKTPTVQQAAGTSAPKDFNAVAFLNNNHPMTRDKLLTLDDKELFLVSQMLELNLAPNLPTGKLIEQILTDIEARNKK